MISEYHTACVINGSSTTSSIPSQEIEEKLPSLVNYTHPAGTGITDVRVWDNKAKSLRVAVWLHWLDMSLSQEGDASMSLVPSRHTQGCLLDYFLAPGTSNLSYGEVLAQVIEENHMELRRMWEHLTSSLQDCNAKRTKYLDKLTNLSKKLDTTGVDRLRGDIKAKMGIVCTAISRIEATIERYANRLEECQFREHEAQSRDQDRSAFQASDDVMVESSTENAKQRFFDAAFNNKPCIGSICINSCKAINATIHQLFDAANSNISNKNVLNIAEATAVSNIPSKISRKMFFPTTFLQNVKDKYEKNSSYRKHRATNIYGTTTTSGTGNVGYMRDRGSVLRNETVIPCSEITAIMIRFCGHVFYMISRSDLQISRSYLNLYACHD